MDTNERIGLIMNYLLTTDWPDREWSLSDIDKFAGVAAANHDISDRSTRWVIVYSALTRLVARGFLSKRGEIMGRQMFRMISEPTVLDKIVIASREDEEQDA